MVVIALVYPSLFLPFLTLTGTTNFINRCYGTQSLPERNTWSRDGHMNQKGLLRVFPGFLCWRCQKKTLLFLKSLNERLPVDKSTPLPSPFPGREPKWGLLQRESETR